MLENTHAELTPIEVIVTAQAPSASQVSQANQL